MSSAGQSLISSLSNIDNCAGHQCDCCQNLQNQINQHEARISALESKLNGLDLLQIIEHAVEKAIQAVGYLIDGVKNELYAAIGKVADAVSRIFSQISDLENKLAALEQEILNLKPSENLADQLQEIRQELVSLSGKETNDYNTLQNEYRELKYEYQELEPQLQLAVQKEQQLELEFADEKPKFN